MTALLEEFRRRYDPGHDLRFDGIKFRPGAAQSVSHDGTPTAFGLCEGFQIAYGRLEWGFVRYHMGGDRAPVDGAGRPCRGVWQPFDSDRTLAQEDGGLVYGWLQRHLHEQWGFETRIAHMDPRADASPELLAAVANGSGLKAGTYLGQVGSYGISSAPDPKDRDASRHSHMEIVSIDQASPLLDELAELRWGPEAMRPYEDGEIIAAYRAREKYRYVTPEVIHDAWEAERKAKGIVWANRFRAVFGWDKYSGKQVTRYSSALLFAGM
jgi:hypothetical protein